MQVIQKQFSDYLPNESYSQWNDMLTADSTEKEKSPV